MLLLFAAVPVAQGFAHGLPWIAPRTLLAVRHATVASIRMVEQKERTQTVTQEWESSPSAMEPSGQQAIMTRTMSRKIFSRYDTSGDGYIDIDELRAALAEAGKPISRTRAQEIFAEVDVNGDGQIDLAEFRQIYSLDASDSLKSISLDLFIDEVRVEVSATQFNGPILFTAAVAAFLGIFWKYIVAISSLYQEGAPSSWLPESLELLQTMPASFLDDYAQAVALAPLLTMACTSCFSYAAGDLVAQVLEGRGQVDQLDLGRCARSALLGFGLHGPLVYGWIGVLEGPLAQLVGGEVGSPGLGFLVLKIVLDQTFFSALINLLYASLNGLLSDLAPRDAFRRARQVLVPAMVSSWRFWPAVQLISYSPLIPIDFKLLWIDTMEILWVAYLSATVNGGSSGEQRDTVPWGEGRLVDRPPKPIVVLDEPGDSDLIYLGPVALVGSLTALAALSWPALVVQVMT